MLNNQEKIELLEEIKNEITDISIVPREGVSTETKNEIIDIACKHIEEKYENEISGKLLTKKMGKGNEFCRYCFSDKGMIIIYTSSTIQFKSRPLNDYVDCRRAVMDADSERVEGVGTPTLADINMKYQTIGSDETGKGEIFKPFVMVATYMNAEDDVMKYIELAVNDSKEVNKRNPYLIEKIGKAVTGIEKWEDIEDKVSSKEVIGNGMFAIRVVSNEEYNIACEEAIKQARKENANLSIKKCIDGVQKQLQNEAHFQVLSDLYEKHTGSIIVVDDYTDGRVDKFKDELSVEHNIPRKDIYLTTKCDAKVIAVALSSIIAYYISSLGLKYVEAEFEKYRKDDVKEYSIPSGAAIGQEFVNMIKPIELETFMNKYAKRYYDNVVKIMK